MARLAICKRSSATFKLDVNVKEKIVKFGVLQFFSWPGRRNPLEVVYDRAFDRIRMMDESGYDAVWLAEHHFSTYSVCPSVHMMGTHIAAHTKNIRIGTAVSLASFYHPFYSDHVFPCASQAPLLLQ